MMAAKRAMDGAVAAGNRRRPIDASMRCRYELCSTGENLRTERPSTRTSSQPSVGRNRQRRFRRMPFIARAHGAICRPVHQRIGEMPDYRRGNTAGATWFFTVNLLQRHGNDLLLREVDRLRDCIARERARRPFSVLAWVVLPDHMHWIWRLPEGDADFPTRWRRIKTDFSRGLEATERRSPVRLSRGERGIWQRRYWEHQIRDADDLIRHVEYIHFNPVKHGHVARVEDWPHSSFHRYVTMGRYPADWAAPVMAGAIGGE